MKFATEAFSTKALIGNPTEEGFHLKYLIIHILLYLPIPIILQSYIFYDSFLTQRKAFAFSVPLLLQFNYLLVFCLTALLLMLVLFLIFYIRKKATEAAIVDFGLKLFKLVLVYLGPIQHLGLYLDLAASLQKPNLDFLISLLSILTLFGLALHQSCFLFTGRQYSTAVPVVALFISGAVELKRRIGIDIASQTNPEDTMLAAIPTLLTVARITFFISLLAVSLVLLALIQKGKLLLSYISEIPVGTFIFEKDRIIMSNKAGWDIVTHHGFSSAEELFQHAYSNEGKDTLWRCLIRVGKESKKKGEEEKKSMMVYVKNIQLCE